MKLKHVSPQQELALRTPATKRMDRPHRVEAAVNGFLKTLSFLERANAVKLG